MSNISVLDGDDIRELLNARERYETLLEARHAYTHSYGGSMRYEVRGETEYLIKRPYRSSTRKSYGKRSPETDLLLKTFEEKKVHLKERIDSLTNDLEVRSRVIRARGLGRVPAQPARILRKLDDVGWLGKSLLLLGTHALYAYEAKAALRVGSSVLATDDVDVLYDARRKLKMAGDASVDGLIGLLRKVDRSFVRSSVRPYSASNKDGFMVDLLEPLNHRIQMVKGNARMSANEEDLVATTTQSSRWLLNTPKFTAIAFDTQGLPVRLVTLDPRVFAMQKCWIVEHDTTRDPAKRRRDEEQARIAAVIATQHLGLSFADKDLSGVPSSFMKALKRLGDLDKDNDQPSW